MKLFLSINCILIFVGLSFSGCYYDKAELLYPQTSCDSTTATYSATIVPVLNQYCTSCHNGTTLSGNIALDTYANVKVFVTNGKLLGCINQSSGYYAMPLNSVKLDACTIAKFSHWISTGAINN